LAWATKQFGKWGGTTSPAEHAKKIW